MISFTIPAFIMILIAIALAGAALGVYLTLTYKAPRHPDETVK